MIGLGIIAAALFTRRRAVERGFPADMSIEILVWVIPAGIVGARFYHVLTDWVPIERWHKIWEGGLGIPGGIFAGVLGALAFVRSRGYDRAKLLDALIPGVPLAQAIGRWGNWWNQELYGRATDLPWAVEIDVNGGVETYHPTFLYESLWNLGLVGVLLAVDRSRRLAPGRLIWVYVAGYAIGRLWIESLRIDNATEILGVRINIWTMSALLLLAGFMLSRSRVTGGSAAEAAADIDSDSEGDGDAADADRDEADADDAELGDEEASEPAEK